MKKSRIIRVTDCGVDSHGTGAASLASGQQVGVTLATEAADERRDIGARDRLSADGVLQSESVVEKQVHEVGRIVSGLTQAMWPELEEDGERGIRCEAGGHSLQDADLPTLGVDLDKVHLVVGNDIVKALHFYSVILAQVRKVTVREAVVPGVVWREEERGIAVLRASAGLEERDIGDAVCVEIAA